MLATGGAGEWVSFGFGGGGLLVLVIDLSVPDVDAFVKRTTGEVAAVWAEGHAVDGLLVAGQCVNTHTAFDVP